MVPLTALWLPMLVSALFVFVASFVIHMVLPYHRGDYRKVQEESAVQDALRRFGIAPEISAPDTLRDDKEQVQQCRRGGGPREECAHVVSCRLSHLEAV